MALNQFKKDCIAAATRLGDYQKISPTDLANGYCKALDDNDTYSQDNYLSALILRYWYKIDRLYKESQGIGLDYDDFAGWLIEAINYACKYRAWQKAGGTVTNAGTAIQQCISTIRKQHYYEYNLDKHRANYNTVSLDASLNDDEDEESNGPTMADLAAVQYGSDESVGHGAEEIIQSYLNRQKIVEAIILDCLAFKDSCRQTKRTTTQIDEEGNSSKITIYGHEFKEFNLVKELNSISDDYEQYFLSKYAVSEPVLESALNAVRKANNQKLYKYVRACLSDLRSNTNALASLY